MDVASVGVSAWLVTRFFSQFKDQTNEYIARHPARGRLRCWHLEILDWLQAHEFQQWSCVSGAAMAHLYL
jgi:hypothetical protein